MINPFNENFLNLIHYGLLVSINRNVGGRRYISKNYSVSNFHKHSQLSKLRGGIHRK